MSHHIKAIRTPKYLTDRLMLRAVTLNDIPSYTKYFVDYEVIRNLADNAPWPYPENGVEGYLKNVILPNQGTCQWTWGIFLKENQDELIGVVDFWKNGTPEHRGFWLGKKFWNRGFMTEAVYPVMDFAFNKVGLNQIIFSNAVGNIKSRKIKEKTGCELIEIRPANFVDPVFNEKEYWRLTSENWEKHKLSHPPNYVEING